MFKWSKLLLFKKTCFHFQDKTQKTKKILLRKAHIFCSYTYNQKMNIKWIAKVIGVIPKKLNMVYVLALYTV